MRAFGASAETLDQARRELMAHYKAQQVEVFPENWYAVRLFDAAGTQWRVVTVGRQMVFVGLDYSALALVHSALRRTVAHAKPLHEVLPQLQQMEAAAMAVLNKA